MVEVPLIALQLLVTPSKKFSFMLRMLARQQKINTRVSWCHCCLPKHHACGCLEVWVNWQTPPTRTKACGRPDIACHYYRELLQEREEEAAKWAEEQRRRDSEVCERLGLTSDRIREIREH